MNPEVVMERDGWRAVKLRRPQGKFTDLWLERRGKDAMGAPKWTEVGWVGLTAANYRREMNRQQWLDLFMRPVDAWVQWRRSGPVGQEYPVMTVPTGALASSLVRRLLYRSEEINSNPNTPSGITLDRPVWFDK